MSTKMSVLYGAKAGPITEVPDNDDVITFYVKNDSDQLVAHQAFNFKSFPVASRHRAFLYGCNKLLTDRTSDRKDKREKLAEMIEVFDFLESGEWAKERVVSAVVVSAAVEALAAMQSMSIADTQAALAQYDKDTRKAILGRKGVVELAAKISKARKDAPIKTLDDMIPVK